MAKSFLQTKEWLDFQNSLGRKTFRFDNGKLIANIIRHDLPFGKNYLYIPHGPEIYLDKISGGLKNEIENFFSYVRNLAREEQSMFIKLEPLQDAIIELIYGVGLRKSSKEVQPKKSVVLELGKSEEEFLEGMHHKTRYNIKVAEKHGITVGPSSDVEIFEKLLKKTAARQRFQLHPVSYYRKLFEFFSGNPDMRADIIFAKYKDQPIAGGLYLTHGDTCYYLHGGSDYDHRELMAPYALHWDAIKYCNARGIKFYDFGGSEGLKWPNLTRFKLNWGGRQVEYPGAFDLPISKFWYAIYNVARKLRR